VVIREALEAAIEIALEQVPAALGGQGGQVYICLDVSGSMDSPLTGRRAGATTNARCVDVAALVTAGLVGRNPRTQVLAFNDTVVSVPRYEGDGPEPVFAFARRLAALTDGGTNCSAPLRQLNRARARGALVIYLSDNQSWVDARLAHQGATAML